MYYSQMTRSTLEPRHTPSFFPDEGVLGLVLAFLGESLVGLEERIVCHKSARQKVTIPWNKGIIQFRIIVFDCSFLATVHTKR